MNRRGKFALIVLLLTIPPTPIFAQLSREQQDQYRALVSELISYRKLSYCGLASFDSERQLPKIDTKQARESATVALMKNIDEYVKAYSPKPGNLAIQARFRHDMYLAITGSAEREVQQFVASEAKTNRCREVLMRANQ